MSTGKLIFVFAGLFFSQTCFSGGIDRFIGEWKSAGRGLTKVQISLVDNQLRIRVFGSCQPQDCDWGTVIAQAYAPNVGANVRETAKAVSAEYAVTFARRILVVYPEETDQIRVEIFTTFIDNSGRSPVHATAILKRAE